MPSASSSSKDALWRQQQISEYTFRLAQGGHGEILLTGGFDALGIGFDRLIATSGQVRQLYSLRKRERPRHGRAVRVLT